MYFILNIILASCVYFINAIELFKFPNTLQYQFENNGEKMFGHKNLNIVRRWIEQPLDHFDSKDNRTWQMRYFENLEFWKAGGLIYLNIGGENEVHPRSLQGGTTYDLAEETNGAMFLSEHRYYGQSKPFYYYSKETFAYLSSKQALADLAKLIKKIKELPQFKASKVVVIGGSYPGNLAAWMRLRYPDLVDAAIASSAPVLAKSDFHEYFETVGEVFKKYGTPGCYNKLTSVFNRYKRLFQTSAGIEQLKKEQKICPTSDMANVYNMIYFFVLEAIPLFVEIQYGNPKQIYEVCTHLENDVYVPAFNVKQYFWNHENHCMHYDFKQFLMVLQTHPNFMPFIYQSCTEFGFFPSTSSKKHDFPNVAPVGLHYSVCAAMFGPEFNKETVIRGVRNTNAMYGGLKPNVTKVVFVNGDMDPWHRLSVLEDLSSDNEVIFLKGTSHCADLSSEKSDDTKQLREAKRYIKSIIKKWIRND